MVKRKFTSAEKSGSVGIFIHKHQYSRTVKSTTRHLRHSINGRIDSTRAARRSLNGASNNDVCCNLQKENETL